MVNIPDAANLVPLMFQAQAKGRSQLQYAAVQDAQKCVSQWTEQTYPDAPDLAANASTKTKHYQIQWRFVTNGGQFDGIIFPALGAFGLPFYPGSSMKGAFCQACTEEQKQRYRLTKDLDKPSLLRFHGGYPVNNWKEKLVDIVHPQQDFQVKSNADRGAYALVSLYKPKINFGISSQLQNTNWEEVWGIWEKALGSGIGCRVSSGYGQINKITGDVLYQIKLHGQGPASKLLDNELEFRPNIFRAALRGHALRIFGGLNQPLAEEIVDELFGGIRQGKEKVGLLGMAFHSDPPQWRSADGQDAYDVTGELIWMLFGRLDKLEHRDCLVKLVEKLTQFALLLGGFGKSWRRADHRKFYPTYTKHLIGCHWEWVNTNNKPVGNLKDASKLIKDVLDIAKEWMELRFPERHNTGVLTDVEQRQLAGGVILKSAREKQQSADTWREAWQTDNVEVWGRIAKNTEDSTVIPWLHSSQKTENKQVQKGSYYNTPKKAANQSIALALQKGTKPPNQASRPSIYRTDVSGRVKDEKKSNEPTQIGRLWHRMYPLEGEKYLELITIFYKECELAQQLITWLGSAKSGFEKIW